MGSETDVVVNSLQICWGFTPAGDANVAVQLVFFANSIPRGGGGACSSRKLTR